VHRVRRTARRRSCRAGVGTSVPDGIGTHRRRKTPFALARCYVSRTSEAQREKADQVLDKVGTNALPVLLRMVRQTDSPFKRTVMDFARKQHFIALHYLPAERRIQAAYFSFLKLGARARAAVPALMEIYGCRLEPSTGGCRWSALRELQLP
jgi:hypothetical protein